MQNFDENNYGFKLGPLGTVAANNQVADSFGSGAGGIQLGTPQQFSGFQSVGSVPGYQTGSLGNLFGGSGGFGSNLQVGLGALQTVGGLWQAYSAGKLAKESLKTQKAAYERNASNQEKSYNTALEDRIRARYATEGRSSAEADSYISKNKL